MFCKGFKSRVRIFWHLFWTSWLMSSIGFLFLRHVFPDYPQFGQLTGHHSKNLAPCNSSVNQLWECTDIKVGGKKGDEKEIVFYYWHYIQYQTLLFLTFWSRTNIIYFEMFIYCKYTDKTILSSHSMWQHLNICN